MTKIRMYPFIAFSSLIIVMASCAATSHPNEKIIVGTWKPVKVEKIVDSLALQSSGSGSSRPNKMKPKDGTPSEGGYDEHSPAAFNRMVQTEMRATLQIFANKTAIKNYSGKPLHATWKMKGHGTRIVAKNVETKMKFVIEILEISKERVVVMEHVPAGDLKITYERVQ